MGLKSFGVSIGDKFYAAYESRSVQAPWVVEHIRAVSGRVDLRSGHFTRTVEWVDLRDNYTKVESVELPPAATREARERDARLTEDELKDLLRNAKRKSAKQEQECAAAIEAAKLGEQGINPKDLVGQQKLGLFNVPLGPLYELAGAHDDGAEKYGAFNWRDYPVLASVYANAAKRHIDKWLQGEERAGDSGVHHLGHAMACMAILLDSQQHDTLKDDRVPSKVSLETILARIKEDRDAAKAKPVASVKGD